jgi:competence CoiA-like predicted nuclease
MHLKKIITIIAITILHYCAFGDSYFVEQLLIADASGTGSMDTTYQKNYISDGIIIVIDEISMTYVDDSTFTLYNMVDSTFFSRSFVELEEFMTGTDSQIKNYDVKPEEKQEKVGNWTAEKYNATATIMGMDMELDLYVAKNTGFPSDLLVRQQAKMYSKSKNIIDVIEKTKSTGGIVVKEVARIGGTVVSEKIVSKIQKIDTIPKDVINKPDNFKKMEQ